jgi:phosphoribosylanthranilate isomerase
VRTVAESREPRICREPPQTRVKICGLTRPQDAKAAADAGADLVGVVLAPSPRQLDLGEASLVLERVPPHIARVAVFVDAPESLVARAVDRLGLDFVQFHGEESPERCAAAPVPVIKAFRVRLDFSARQIDPYRESIGGVLLDTFDPSRAGGTGRTFDLAALPPLPAWARLFVAGGLSPANVGDAIRAVRPFAVDVSSGVEHAPGHKDPKALAAFFSAVRAADREVT